MKNLVKISAAVLALSLCLCGCGKDKTPDPTEPDATEPAPTVTQEATPDAPEAPAPNNTQMLLSTADAVMELDTIKREHYDNGTYYYLDAAGNGVARCISSCYLSTIKDGETEEEYASRRAIGLSATMTPGKPYNLTVAHNEELSNALGYPVYLVSYYTGSDLKTVYWNVYLTRTENYSYQYAFSCTPEQADQLSDAMDNYFVTLKLAEMPA